MVLLVCSLIGWLTIRDIDKILCPPLRENISKKLINSKQKTKKDLWFSINTVFFYVKNTHEFEEENAYVFYLGHVGNLYAKKSIFTYQLNKTWLKLN